jgi:hypothetical protein
VSILSRECEANAWMEIALRDGPGNRDGLGALVEVWVGDRILRRRIGIGSSGVHQAAQPTAHFGLGDATVVERMRITWADGADVEYEALPVRSRLVVERL